MTFKPVTFSSPEEDTQYFKHRQRRKIALLWINKTIQAADIEADAFIQVSRGRSKYNQSTVKFTVYAATGDTYIHSLEGEQICYGTVCTFRAASWAQAIEKANAVFPAKYEAFKQKIADGTLKESPAGILTYLGAKSRGLA